MTYLGGSVDIRTLPQLAVNLHMAVAEYVCRGTVHMPDVYVNVVAPWFGAFWWRVFNNARFRFIMPKFVEMDLKEALESDPGVVVQRVLRAAAIGLGMQLPERGREWFENARQRANA
jgi:hypothetical protein